ncbi:MAG: type II toxin-antitoxin system VapC family toxin [Euryarchaeota archaeon]|nr:type II toxin-antitoxin system VapC family toxin [Euryarchaeota archaeon]
MKFFVDTSIFVDYLRKDVVPASKSFIKSLMDVNTGYTSTITVAELSVGAHLSPKKDALKKTLNLLAPVILVDIDRNIAIEGGRIYSSLVKSGEEIELNDCLIAAAATSVGIDAIVTRNLKHFGRIEGIRAITPEEAGI